MVQYLHGGEGEPSQAGDDGKKPEEVAKWELMGFLVVLGVGLLVLLGALSLVIYKFGLLVEKNSQKGNGNGVAIAVALETVKPQTVVDTIQLPGVVSGWVEVDVPAEVSGRVISTKDTPLSDGAKVRKGQAILHIDPRDSQIRLKQAKATLDLAREDYERTLKLRRQKVRTQSDLDRDKSALEQAESGYDAAKLQLSRCVIHSPIDGVVNDVIPEVGEYINSSSVVARVLDLSRVKIEVGIPERDVVAVGALVEKKESIDVIVDAVRDGYKLRGRCYYLSTEPSRDSLVYTLRLEVDNRDGLIRSRMFAKADVVRGVRPNSIKVPFWAVIARGKEHIAYIAKKKTVKVKVGDKSTSEAARNTVDGSPQITEQEIWVAEERAVKLGVIQGDFAEVLEGINPGDLLVVRGQRSLAGGSKLRVSTIDGERSGRQK